MNNIFIYEGIMVESFFDNSIEDMIAQTPIITDEVKEEVKEEKFIDPETGKEYKTARGLKAAIARRKKKEKK